jgi:hypothetical protein
MRFRDSGSLALLLVVAAIALTACLGDCRAQAQSRPRSADVADVARCLCAEDEQGGDWPAILDVLERRAAAHGMRVASMARAYCAIFVTRAPSARQARILALPGGSPSPRLAALYRRAVEAATRGGPGTCAASHWGAATGEDHTRAVRAGWSRTGCGPTRNAFWSL